MKTKTILAIAFYACHALFGLQSIYDRSDSALPMLAAVCDIAGIGEIVSQTSTNAVININQCWFSTGPINTVEVRLYRDENFPAGGTNFMFFASQYSMDYGPNMPEPYPSMFRMNEVRGGIEPNASMHLMGAGRSLIPVTAENSTLISWSSNLVHASQINPNMQTFYELINDGYRLSLESSRMHCDSLNAFSFANCYMTTNFMQHIWNDTNLIYKARSGISNAHNMAAGSFLEWHNARDGDSALPLLAAVCDVIGIGEVGSKTSTNAVINVSQIWLGDAQQNILDVRLDGERLPEAGAPFLFFLSKHPQIDGIEPRERRFGFMFDSDARSRLQSGSLYFLGGSRAVIPATQETSTLTNWCFSLVQTSQISPNMQAFYELIRDGLRQNPPASRKHADSRHAFKQCGYFMPLNFMSNIWGDSNLVHDALGCVKAEYLRVNGSLDGL
jgi:hypothetical protein